MLCGVLPAFLKRFISQFVPESKSWENERNRGTTSAWATKDLIGGACKASFYGWLPLYLPELFPTKIRGTGQGFSFNLGRILAAIGARQTGAIMSGFSGGYSQACSIMGSVYLVGLAVIWLGPETRNQPLPE